MYLALNDFSMKKSILPKGTLVSYQFAYLGEKINQGKSELIQEKILCRLQQAGPTVFIICEWYTLYSEENNL